ncbi:uncharacterized protein CTRU02_209217 [Colletotrichum truncatum]|uniref:Uncharacterized protein n=1 Tax=Colletotrichum truncatum TaxID=5467 RepID=A0ACC3YYL7_COLTU|nr:uncharacterized protein CTRU02_14605 [Colletotrichum truncatum]KAF6782049.1 hypothetical protein CTRU02_14605 [Colletotrichum truncatum]
MHQPGLRSVTLTVRIHHDIMAQPASGTHHCSDTHTGK